MGARENLQSALFDKMSAEQDRFREWLLSQPPEEILNHAYEYAVREDILLEMENVGLSNAQASALLRSENPLADVFKAYSQRATDYQDNINDCISEHADEELKRAKEEVCSVPVYPHPASYAREHGELELYRASRKANEECKTAIEKAISQNFDGMCLSERSISQVAERFGFERMNHVLANTVLQKRCDLRFSNSTQDWAKTVPVVPDIDGFGQDRNLYLSLNSHSAVLETYIRMVRKAQEREKEQETGRDRRQRGKTSVLEKLSSGRGKSGSEENRSTAKGRKPDVSR